MALTFREKDAVRVKRDVPGPNRRTPKYVRGKVGTVLRSHGVVEGYAHDHADFRGPMYSVMFECSEIFGYHANAKVVLDIHESWLDPA